MKQIVKSTVKSREKLNAGMFEFSILSKLTQFRPPYLGNGTAHSD